MFCSQCGEKLPDSAYFCLRCGIRSSKGVEAGIPYPWKWEKELEKALSTAAQEMEKAFNSIRASVQKTIKREPIVCPFCGEKNQRGSKFCYTCGKELL